jgi:hypothetical protein
MKRIIKKRFPKLAATLAGWHLRMMRWMPMEYVFTKTYKHGGWGCGESVSGRGSTLQETKKIRSELPSVFSEFQIRSLLDVPCGDFNWMKEVAPHLSHYTGGDIVKDLVTRNLATYGNESIDFVHLNALKDKLPRVDCILCRDMLVHFPFRDILGALRNMKASGSGFLLATTFPATEQNVDIHVGEWRMINLERPPISLPPPLRVINEECPSKPDKSLGLWRLSDLPV